jgi:hypothetical protein
LVALALVVIPSLHADIFGVTFANTTGAQTLLNPPFTLGWEFTVTGTIQVFDLAFYDDGENGLVDSHQLGLWNSTGTLLASGTVLAGTASPLVNQWREVAVSPVQLGPGNYFVGGLFLDGNDPVWFPGLSNLTGFASGPGITYDQATFAFGSTLSNPTIPDGSPGFFGANFVFSPTPEPGSVLLLLTVVAGVLIAFRRTLLAR